MYNEITFGQVVREHRSVLGLTQSELARRVGCAAITIRKIEADDLRPSVQMAELIAVALNVPDQEQLPFVRLARAQKEPSPIPTPSPAPGEIGRSDLSGRAVKGFQLGEKIGSGGFGVVYRAVQPSVERDVAVKIILPRYANQPAFIRRFEAEAHLIARLEHPHIVPLYDYWREPDAAFLIMRYLRGGSLEDQLRKGPIQLELLYKLMRQIGLALDVAHRNGIVHRDIKPANVLLDEEANAYLADFGIAKDLERVNSQILTEASALIGSPAYISPEQIMSERVRPQSDIYCLGIMMFEMLTGHKPFSGPTPIAFIQQHLNESLPSLQTYDPNLPLELDGVIQQATTKKASDRYQDVPSLLRALQQALFVVDLAIGTPEFGGTPFELTSEELANLENPYKGLRAFTEADAERFYGRDTLIQELFTKLSEPTELARFLAVVGPSGSGKSSVVKAGLVPALRRGGLPGSENWFLLDFTPGAHPWEELESTLLRAAVNPPETLLNQLQDGNRGLLRAVRRILPDDGKTELVLVIDQFEELFTLVEEESVREQFLNSLVTAMLDERSRLRVIVTLRADFYDRPLQYVDFGDMLSQRSVSVLPMTPDELDLAISRPALQVDVHAEQGLTAAIIHDVDNQPGALPLLQYVLTELFERRDKNIMTRAAYEEAGGVTGALARRADEIYEGLAEEGRAAARQLLLRLITLGEGIEDTRRRVHLSELGDLSSAQTKRSVFLTSDHMDEVISEFGRYRLLTFDRDPVTREPTLEVAHEALLREWGRLRGWLEESRDDIRRQRLLATSAAQWMAAGKDASYLLRGSRLAEFEGWFESKNNKPGAIALTGLERRFLDASLASREQRRADEWARQQRELETARQLVETERARAEEQSQSARTLRRRAALLAAALVVAALLAITAFTFARRSNQNAVVAQQNAGLAATRESEAQAESQQRATAQVLAETERERANDQRNAALSAEARAIAEAEFRATAEAEAVAEREVAQQQADLAKSRELSSAALNNMEADPELSILLAMQALNTRYTKEAEEALHQGLQSSRVLMTLADHTEQVQGVAYSQDGSNIATVSLDGTVKLWDAESGQLLRSLPYSGIDFLGQTLTFDDEGMQLLLVAIGRNYENAIVDIWDVDSGELRSAQSLPIPLENWSLDISPDWRLVVVGRENATAELWDIETAEKVLTFSGHDEAVVGVSFSHDGSRLVTTGTDGQVQIWNVESSLMHKEGQLVTSFQSYIEARLSESIYSEDGRRLVLVFADSAAEIWNLDDTSQPPIPLVGHSNWVQSAAFHPNDIWLATAAADGTAKVWDSATGEELFTLAGHKGFVYRLAFSPDGAQLVTVAQDRTARIWDAEPWADGELLTFAASGPTDYMDLKLSPDERTVALGSNSGPATVRDAQTGELLHTLAGEGDSRVYRVAYNPDGSRIATVGEDGFVRIWDAESGDSVIEFIGHVGGNSGGRPGTLDVAYSLDGTRLATAGADGLAKVWDAETGQELLTFDGQTAGLHSLAFSPDGQYIATSSDTPDSTVKVWDALTGEVILSLETDAGRAWGLDFSPDGDLLAVGGQGGYLKVWDVSTGEEVGNLAGQSATIGTVAFTHDGKRLISGGVNSVSIWDIMTGVELLNLAPINSWKVALSQDGRRLYVADFITPAVRVYAVTLDDALNLANSRLTRPLSEAECLQYLHVPTCPDQ